MKKKMVGLACLLLSVSSAFPAYAATDYGINIDNNYVAGDAAQLSDVISEALADMGVEKVSSYDLEKKEKSQTVARVILSADSVVMKANCYYLEEGIWKCSSITNIDSNVYDEINYWINPDEADSYAFEIKDYKTGEYTPSGAAKDVIVQYKTQEKWFSKDDFNLYDSKGSLINSSKSEDYMTASNYPNSKTYRDIEIGDSVSDIFSVYEPKYFNIQLGYKDDVDSDEEEKIINMYNEQIEKADPEDIENTISSIDSNMVNVAAMFEGAEFCGEIIPMPSIEDKISYKSTVAIAFLIENNKVSEILIQQKDRF